MSLNLAHHGEAHAFSWERRDSFIVTGTVARACNGTVPKQCKASMMATKQILEGARSFKTVPLSDSSEPATHQAEHSRWRWPAWPSISSNRKDLYLIDIRPRRPPDA